MEKGKQLEELTKLSLEARIKILDYFVARLMADLDITTREYTKLSTTCILCSSKLASS